MNLLVNKGGEIDWGDFDANSPSDLPIESVDYDLDALRNEISVEDAGVYIPSDGIAKDTDAYCILEWLETRNLLLLDLLKVRVYLN
jgi:hypothetical protein